MQHREPAWALFFTWEMAEMSFRRAIKATEQLPRFVVMISGFHSLEQIPLKLPLWFVNQQLPCFLGDIITTNKSVESPGRSEGSGLYFQGLFFFYFLGCARDSGSISWNRKKAPWDLFDRPASCFLNMHLTFSNYLVGGGVQNRQNHSLAAL